MGEAAVSDPYDLQRFVDAQDPIFRQVHAELRDGRKTSHWMWFIFPQIFGLGQSAMAKKFAISSRAEAAAYLRHPILGPRLRECTQLVNRIEGRTAKEIFGEPDDLKFRSSMTLFAAATPANDIYETALRKYFGGVGDPMTLAKL